MDLIILQMMEYIKTLSFFPSFFLSFFIYFFLSFLFPFLSCLGPFSDHSLHVRGFTITLRHTAISRTLLNEVSAPRRDLYLTKLNNHNRKTNMTLAGFEPAIPARERSQTQALDLAATGSSKVLDVDYKYHLFQK